MKKIDMKTGEENIQTAYFRSDTSVVLKGTNLDSLYNTAKDEMLEKMASYVRKGSNWVLDSVVRLEINTVKYDPLKGKSYIPLPDVLAKKKAIINIKNTDNECFKWCVTRALNPVEKNAELVSKLLREQAKKLDWSSITFPVSLKDIDKFEKQNPGIAVNVFGYENHVYPLKISNRYAVRPALTSFAGAADASAACTAVNLLLLSTSDGDCNTNNHYCLIKNMSRLLYSQAYTKHKKRYYCLRCLNGFPSEDHLALHENYCSTRDPQKNSYY
jgi:hypothetical protein